LNVISVLRRKKRSLHPSMAATNKAALTPANN
jgi:hypothetical protein